MAIPQIKNYSKTNQRLRRWAKYLHNRAKNYLFAIIFVR
jgi:hypothetical protein